MRETAVENGAVRGIACGWPSITVFYGIPYAAPPVGRLRWQPPQPAASWTGVRDCARPAPRCPQPPVNSFYRKEFYPVDEEMNEDCLYLNVWTPAREPGEKLPVIFWVHGGAFLTGYGTSAHFDGEPFARQGVILVTINYRLGIFGWMVHPELSAGSESGTSGNYGLLDQLCALDWVRRNIAAFGGDPENITIAGQSAGAMCMQMLFLSPMAKGKFSRAIFQSGGGPDPVLDKRALPLAEVAARADLSLLGVGSLEEARALPWQELFRRWKAVSGAEGLCQAPVVDGWVLPAPVAELARKGDCPAVPCLIGYTDREGLPAAPSFARWVELLKQNYTPGQVKDYLALSGGEAGFANYERDHYRIHCRASAESWALLQERRGAETYLYCFDRALPGDGRGAFHAADLWYVFSTLGRGWRPWTKDDYWLAHACTTYWAQFAKSGNPNVDGLPDWTPYSSGNSQTMELGTSIGMTVMDEDDRVRFRRNVLLSEPATG